MSPLKCRPPCRHTFAELSFEEAYRLHRKSVQFILFRRGAPQKEKEDLIAEVFLRAWQTRRRDRFVSVMHLLGAIARNVVARHHTKRRIEAFALEELEPQESRYPGPERTAQAREELQLALSRVRGRQALVLKRNLVDDEPLPRIARDLCISSVHARQIVSRARKAARAALPTVRYPLAQAA